MDTPMLGEYASVEGLPHTERKMTYTRGFGNIIILTEQSDGKVSTKSTPYNRLQPLTGPYGEHNPAGVAPELAKLNPQHTLAWTGTNANTPKA